MRLIIGVFLLIFGVAAMLIGNPPANIVSGVLLMAGGVVAIVGGLRRRRV